MRVTVDGRPNGDQRLVPLQVSSWRNIFPPSASDFRCRNYTNPGEQRQMYVSRKDAASRCCNSIFTASEYCTCPLCTPSSRSFPTDSSEATPTTTSSNAVRPYSSPIPVFTQTSCVAVYEVSFFLHSSFVLRSGTPPSDNCTLLLVAILECMRAFGIVKYGGVAQSASPTPCMTIASNVAQCQRLST